MATCNRQYTDADLHSSAQYYPCSNGLFDSRVRAARIAHTGHASLDRVLHIVHRIEEAHGEWSGHLTNNIHALQHEVNMGINKSGQDRAAGRVNFKDRFVGKADAIRLTDSLNTVILDQHSRVREGCCPCAINQCTVAD